jgi:hypothetical protein
MQSHCLQYGTSAPGPVPLPGRADRRAGAGRHRRGGDRPDPRGAAGVPPYRRPGQSRGPGPRAGVRPVPAPPWPEHPAEAEQAGLLVQLVLVLAPHGHLDDEGKGRLDQAVVDVEVVPGVHRAEPSASAPPPQRPDAGRLGGVPGADGPLRARSRRGPAGAAHLPRPGRGNQAPGSPRCPGPTVRLSYPCPSGGTRVMPTHPVHRARPSVALLPPGAAFTPRAMLNHLDLDWELP